MSPRGHNAHGHVGGKLNVGCLEEGNGISRLKNRKWIAMLKNNAVMCLKVLGELSGKCSYGIYSRVKGMDGPGKVT